MSTWTLQQHDVYRLSSLLAGEQRLFKTLQAAYTKHRRYPHTAGGLPFLVIPLSTIVLLRVPLKDLYEDGGRMPCQPHHHR